MGVIVVMPKLRPLLDVIEAENFPATLYISLADWGAVRNFIKADLDEQGAFFWLLTTKVRVKRSEATVDVSDRHIYPTVKKSETDLPAEESA